jgi:hypothetical protein
MNGFQMRSYAEARPEKSRLNIFCIMVLDLYHKVH